MQVRLSATATKEIDESAKKKESIKTSAFTPVDFVFVTALEEERDALLKYWPSAQPVPPSLDDVRFYYQGTIPARLADGTQCAYTAVLVPLLNMGRVSAALATSDAIRRWRPRYVVLVGVARGIASREVQLGDLIISDQVVDYETQKITDGGLPDIRWNVQLADPRLLGAAKNLPLTDVEKKISTARPTAGQLVKHIGPIATGDKIVAAADLLKQHGQVWSKLLGVEVEGGGVACATFESVDKPGFFMIRAVSDMADAAKISATVLPWRPYACDAAAAFAISFIESGPVPPRSKTLNH